LRIYTTKKLKVHLVVLKFNISKKGLKMNLVKI